jgi:hypothetical protein
MAEVIPTTGDLAAYRQTTTLDGRSYVLRFLHNPRLDRWSISIADEADVPIVQGRAVVTETDLLTGVVDPRRPPGILIARDLTAPDDAPKIASIDPGFGELGTRVVLMYIPIEEAEAAGFA